MEINLHYRVCEKIPKTNKVGFQFDYSEVTKSHPEGDDDVEFLMG